MDPRVSAYLDRYPLGVSRKDVQPTGPHNTYEYIEPLTDAELALKREWALSYPFDVAPTAYTCDTCPRIHECFYSYSRGSLNGKCAVEDPSKRW